MHSHFSGGSASASGGAAAVASSAASGAGVGSSMQAYASPASHGFGGLAAAASAAPPLAAPLLAHAPPGGVDAAAAHMAARNKRKDKAHDLDPSVVASYRAGWTRLVSVRAFAHTHSALQSQLRSACSALDAQPSLPDLRVDDLRIDTPFQTIDKEIDKEVARANELQLSKAKQAAEAVAERKRKDQERLEQQRRGERERQLKAQQQKIEADAYSSGVQTHMLMQAAVSAAAEAASAAGASFPAAAAAAVLPHVAAALSEAQRGAGAGVGPPQLEAIIQQVRAGAQPPASQSDPPPAALAAAAAPAAAPSSSAAAAAPAAAPLTMGAVAQAAPLPPNFGSNVPKHHSLMAPLRSLLEQRAVQLGKRGRLESNVMTALSFAHDRAALTAGHPAEPMQPDEVILRVAVYHPTHFAKMQEFLVCASQPLTSLRDRIACLQDGELDGGATLSACFFIENTFYSDMRSSRAIDLSDAVVAWARSEGRFAHPSLAPFQQADMHAATFAHLSVRLGAHYFFQHQGDCRHVLVFTQMRMARRDDEQNLRAYPLRVFQGKTKRSICRVCDIFPATRVTYGDELASESPFFFCDECYDPLHYSAPPPHGSGLLLYQHQVFPYKHE